MKKIVLSLFLLLVISPLFSQKNVFTKQDTLRGSITKERIWWNLNHYNLSVDLNVNDKFIKGKNIIKYTVLEPYQIMQIDLQDPLNISKVTQDNVELYVENIGPAHFITLQKKQHIGDKNEIVVYYEGQPQEANNPPWDGGLSWKKDKNNIDFISTSCQGIGASIWWPCKDHMYDEPESMSINITAPDHLVSVANGRLKKVVDNYNGTKTFSWFVGSPLNNYGVNMNIGDYVHFSEKYKGALGFLDCDYYVLRDDLEKAKKQFKDVPRMLEAFEHWFGPYPFYNDGYKLVQVSYLGMEHQSSVTYGNKFNNGYLGTDISGTGWGLKFDYIIIHESGHEWFANNITYKDIADMWIHESFTAYSESLFLDYHYGKKASSEYIIGTRKNIRNDKPIIGKYDVNKEGSGDMYYKGANLLHTIRQLVNNDDKWREILRGLNEEFYHKTVTTAEVENYLNNNIDFNLTPVFNQYLRDVRIPVLEYKFYKNEFHFRWTKTIENFFMPVKVSINKSEKWIHPTQTWKILNFEGSSKTFSVDENFFIDIKNVD